jgi:hypothetical protein
MKSLLTKFRISTAFDARRPLSESLRQKVAANPSLQRFVSKAEALRALPGFVPAGSALHYNIMRAVRASANAPSPLRAPVLPFLAASGTISAVILVAFWVIHPGSVMPDTASPVGALALVIKRAIEGAMLP